MAYAKGIKGITENLWEEILGLLTTGWLASAMVDQTSSLDLDCKGLLLLKGSDAHSVLQHNAGNWRRNAYEVRTSPSWSSDCTPPCSTLGETLCPRTSGLLLPIAGRGAEHVICLSRNIQKALDLVNVIADERHRLYVEFMGDGHSTGQTENRLKEYLGLVREASLAALATSNDPFIVASE